MPPGNVMLTLNVLRGRKFAPGVSSIRVSATFARENKTTSLAHGNGRDGFAWGCVLQWKIDTDSLRKASAQGVGNCKVVVEGPENEIHGWIVIDMRSAKMNAIRADYEGDWIALSGPKAHPLHETPELFLHFTYQDEQHLSSMERKNHLPPPSPSRAKILSSPSKRDAFSPKEMERDPLGDVQPKQIQEEAGVNETLPAMEKPQKNHSENCKAAGIASILPSGEGPQRHFKMTVDFRGVNSNSSLLKSNPPVNCVRGAEVILAGGYSVMQFYTGIVNLATVLAKEPRIVIDVWHREPMKSDTLLGVASLPLSPLLQQTFIDSSSPVYAMIVKPSQPGQKKTSFEKQVEIGSIRVAISIEDLGQPPPQVQPNSKEPKEGGAFVKPAENGGLGETTAENRFLENEGLVKKQGGKSSNEILEPPFPGKDGGKDFVEHLGRHGNMCEVMASSTSAERNFANQNPVSQNHPAPEYTTAWELELWKRNEEEKFLEGLEQRERERMAVLENEWRKHEKLREEEVGALRGECASLEIRLKEMLESVEERERKLTGAEESQSRRKKELEREYTTRISEAEAAVRRLQVECEHQLTIERDRNAELSRLKQSAEERLSIAETRCISLEKNFAEFRHNQQNTPEAKLQWEIQMLKEKLQKAEQKNEKLLKAKSKYKMEVIRLAQEIAEQHRESQGGCGGPELQEFPPHLLLQNSDRVRFRTNALRLAAEENVARSQVQREQLCSLKNELETLKLGSTCASPPPPALSDAQISSHNKASFQTPIHTQPVEEKNGVPAHISSGANETDANQGLTREKDDMGQSRSHLDHEIEENGEANCGLRDRIEPQSLCAEAPKVERLLKQRHELLELGVYGKDDDVIKAIDTRIELVLRSCRGQGSHSNDDP